MLKVEGLVAGYGLIRVLNGVSLAVGEGEFVGVIGPNGAGKTTLMRALVGLLKPESGAIELSGRTITGRAPEAVVALGMALVPEGRQIFPNLAVRENLVATAANSSGSSDPWTYETVVELFPRLAERATSMGNLLSGGEQQMLAIGRALMTNPRLLILDEATEGLAPLIRQEIWQCLTRLKQAGQSILVIDKNVAALIAIADRHYLIERGRTVWSGTSKELGAAPDIQHRYLGV